MEKKSVYMPILFFLIVFLVLLFIYNTISGMSGGNSVKEEDESEYIYSCVDYEKNKIYKFKNEKDMHKICDDLVQVEENPELNKYPIYKDIKNLESDEFSFYPYISNDKKLSIMVTIINCSNKGAAIEKVRQWFSSHSYNIDDYNVNYQYACE